LQEEAAAAAYVQNQSGLLGFPEGAFDEMEMVAQDEAAIPLFQAIGGVAFGDVPVAGRVVIVQFQRGRLGMEANEAAFAALDDLEDFRGGAVEAIGS